MADIDVTITSTYIPNPNIKKQIAKDVATGATTKFKDITGETLKVQKKIETSTKVISEKIKSSTKLKLANINKEIELNANAIKFEDIKRKKEKDENEKKYRKQSIADRKKRRALKEQELSLKKQSQTMNSIYRTALPFLFVTQAAAQAFKSILQPANDLVGVQETLNDLTAAAFLPTAIENLDAVINFGTELNNLDEAKRRNLGSNIRLGEVTTNVASTITEATLAGAGFGNILGGVTAGLGAAAVGASILNDKQLTMVASIMGPMSTALANTQVGWSDVRAEQKKVEVMVDRLAEQGADPEIIKMLSTPASNTIDGWKKALDSLIEYYNELSRRTGGGSIKHPTTKEQPTATIPIYVPIQTIPTSGPGLGKVGGSYTNTPSIDTSKINPNINTYAPKGSLSGFNDFISRPGSAPVSFSNQDTIIGVKKPEQMFGSSSNVTQNITINVTGTKDMDERRLSDLIGRQIREETKRFSMVR